MPSFCDVQPNSYSRLSESAINNHYILKIVILTGFITLLQWPYIVLFPI